MKRNENKSQHNETIRSRNLTKQSQAKRLENLTVTQTHRHYKYVEHTENRFTVFRRTHNKNQENHKKNIPGAVIVASSVKKQQATT